MPPKIVQTIYECMRIRPPLDVSLRLGSSNVGFTHRKLTLMTQVGRPIKVSDDNRVLGGNFGNIVLHPGVYLVIESPCPTGSDEEIQRLIENNHTIAAWVSVFFGKRAAERHIGDNVELGRSRQIVTPTLRQPAAYEFHDISQDDLQQLKIQFTRMANGPGRERGRIELALNWFMKGRREDNPVDAFVSHWVAIEVLIGQWKNMDRRISRLIKQISKTSMTEEEVRKLLRIRDLVALRHKVLHRGHTVLTQKENYFVFFLREIAEEGMRQALGLAPRGRLPRHFKLAEEAANPEQIKSDPS